MSGQNGSVCQPGVFTTYRIVANGPIRVVFELFYDTLRVAGTLNRETRRISLDAGQNLNIVVPAPSYEGTAEDAAHHLIVGKTRTGESTAYFAGAGWTRSGDFPTAESWQRYLARFAACLQTPVTVALTLQQ